MTKQNPSVAHGHGAVSNGYHPAGHVAAAAASRPTLASALSAARTQAAAEASVEATAPPPRPVVPPYEPTPPPPDRGSGNGEIRFVRGEMVEVQEGVPGVKGVKRWYTGFIAYSWYDDLQEWTGYAIQFIYDDLSGEPDGGLGEFVRRVPANRVRAVTGEASDFELARDSEWLAIAHHEAKTMHVSRFGGNPKGEDNGARARRSRISL